MTINNNKFTAFKLLKCAYLLVFLVFCDMEIKNLGIVDCWSDKARQFNKSTWALCKCNRHFPYFLTFHGQSDCSREQSANYGIIKIFVWHSPTLKLNYLNTLYGTNMIHHWWLIVIFQCGVTGQRSNYVINTDSLLAYFIIKK